MCVSNSCNVKGNKTGEGDELCCVNDSEKWCEGNGILSCDLGAVTSPCSSLSSMTSQGMRRCGADRVTCNDVVKQGKGTTGRRRSDAVSGASIDAVTIAVQVNDANVYVCWRESSWMR